MKRHVNEVLSMEDALLSVIECVIRAILKLSVNAGVLSGENALLSVIKYVIRTILNLSVNAGALSGENALLSVPVIS